MSLKAQAKKRAFTLVELLIVVIIIAVLAAIAIPKFINSSLRSKEASLKGELKLLRDAAELFKNDCGCYPSALSVLATSTAPTSGVTSSNANYTIATGVFKGPYISSVDLDPISGAVFNYDHSQTVTCGTITSSASGNDSNGSPYSGY